jgi:hypothetical protein
VGEHDLPARGGGGLAATEDLHALANLLAGGVGAGGDFLIAHAQGRHDRLVQDGRAVERHRPEAPLGVPRRGDLADHRGADLQVQQLGDGGRHRDPAGGDAQHQSRPFAELREHFRKVPPGVLAVPEDVHLVAQVRALNDRNVLLRTHRSLRGWTPGRRARSCPAGPET